MSKYIKECKCIACDKVDDMIIEECNFESGVTAFATKEAGVFCHKCISLVKKSNNYTLVIEINKLSQNEPITSTGRFSVIEKSELSKMLGCTITPEKSDYLLVEKKNESEFLFHHSGGKNEQK